MTASVVLADEDVLFRTALALTLDSERSYRVAAQASDVATATAAVTRHDPDLVVVSNTLPGGGPAAVCERAGAHVRVLVLSEASDHAALVQALDAGAQGYLGKDAELPTLTAALQALLRGEAFVPSAMLSGLLLDLVAQRRHRKADDPGATYKLSRREREVLELLAEGIGQDDIASRLVISPQTARTHIQNVISKLGVHSRIEAVALALDVGLVEAS